MQSITFLPNFGSDYSSARARKRQVYIFDHLLCLLKLFLQPSIQDCVSALTDNCKHCEC